MPNKTDKLLTQSSKTVNNSQLSFNHLNFNSNDQLQNIKNYLLCTKSYYKKHLKAFNNIVRDSK
jgi:hypothetical protein